MYMNEEEICRFFFCFFFAVLVIHTISEGHSREMDKNCEAQLMRMCVQESG